MMPFPAVASMQNRIFARENPIHIVLIQSSLVSMLVIARATSLVLSPVAQRHRGRRKICAGMNGRPIVPTFALA